MLPIPVTYDQVYQKVALRSCHGQELWFWDFGRNVAQVFALYQHLQCSLEDKQWQLEALFFSYIYTLDDEHFTGP